MRRAGEVVTEGRDPRARVGLRLRRRPQHRRGVRRPVAPQGRPPVRPCRHRDRARERLPAPGLPMRVRAKGVRTTGVRTTGVRTTGVRTTGVRTTGRALSRRAASSARFRITTIASVFVLLVTAVGSVVIVAMISHTISHSLVDSARQDAEAIDAQLKRGVSPAAAATTGRNDVVVQLLGADGKVAASDRPERLGVPLRDRPWSHRVRSRPRARRHLHRGGDASDGGTDASRSSSSADRPSSATRPGPRPPASWRWQCRSSYWPSG